MQKMQEWYQYFYAGQDCSRILQDISALTALELGQTSHAYAAAARHTLALLQAAGIPQAELLSFPADGRTAYQDKRMPLAWEATIGKLTLLNTGSPDYNRLNFSGPDSSHDFVAADFQQHPFHLVKGSVATAPGGQIARIITEGQFLSGEDPRGCLVMLQPLTSPRAAVLKPILDQGGLGIISDYLQGRYKTPDALQWVNACTEGAHWHVQADDRPFVAFSVTPRIGDFIRDRATAGALKARVECDGRRYEGTLPAVTALLPGRRSEEVWLLAHLYEPLADDDSFGVVAAIEAARGLMARGTPEFSVRLVFAMEFYGYAAYAASRGENLRPAVVGALNLDSSLAPPELELQIHLAGPGTPFYGNALAELLVRALAKQENAPRFAFNRYPGAYHDDQFLSDPSVGVPTIWPLPAHNEFWHNSSQTAAWLSREGVRRGAAICSTLVEMLANPRPEWLGPALRLAEENLADDLRLLSEKPFGRPAERLRHCWQRETERLQDFARFCSAAAVQEAVAALAAKYRALSVGLADSEKPTPWRAYAAGLVLKRQTVGLPYDLAKVPVRQRRRLPDGVLYGPFANILANLDGRKDLGQVIREAEYEYRAALSEAQVKKYVDAVCYLADWGYLSLLQEVRIGVEEIVAALRQLGVREGDLLLVHSSLSGCGHITGGAMSIITALKQAVGPGGTLLFPTFTRPYIYLGDVLNKNYNYRPFDPADTSQIWVGAVPQAFLEQNPAPLRSRHITHSWAGVGPLAEECLRQHQPCDPPAGESSPLALACQHQGKVLFFGCPLASVTFLHYLETHCQMPFLQPAVCRRRTPDGGLETVLIDKHLPGHRDFYCGNQAHKCKFFRRAFERGLQLQQTSLGVGMLQMLSLPQLFEIGCQLLREDPRVLLCDDPECTFCRQF